MLRTANCLFFEKTAWLLKTRQHRNTEAAVGTALSITQNSRCCRSGLCAHHSLPLWLKMPSISMLLREWAMQRDPQGTRPSAAGDRSVVRTRHQSGLSWGLSSTSTVCPRRMVSSLLLQAVKSWITTVSSHPPDNCEGREQGEGADKRWLSNPLSRTVTYVGLLAGFVLWMR